MTEQEQKKLIRRKVLGWGLACERIDPRLGLGRDLRLTPGATGRDLARVEGLDNLAQSLEVALTTLKGDDVFNTAFGFDGLNALVEETNPVMVRERVRVAIIQVLRREPRIRRIVDVKLDDGRLDAAPSQAVAVEPGASPELHRELSVRVVCEVVSGDQVAVDLGKVTQDV